MKHCREFFLLLSVGVITNALPTSKIVGGHDAPDGKYTYQISLQDSLGNHQCGGSIINKKWILTAAHCVNGATYDDLRIMVGSSSLIKPGKIYQVEDVIINDYKEYDRTGDLALVKTLGDIEFDNFVQPINITSKNYNEAGYPTVLTGWGRLNANKPRPNQLQEIQLQLDDQCHCRQVWAITNAEICTLTEMGQGACIGDSGGPLVTDDVQIGIVSYGDPCAKGRPDVFTRIYYYHDWIHEHSQV